MKKEILQQIYRMTFVLAMLSALTVWQFDFVKSAVEANIFLNATIIGVFLFGCFLLYRNAIGLFNEAKAVSALRSDYAMKNHFDQDLYEQTATVFYPPILLGHAYSLLDEEILSTGQLRIGTATMQNLVDGVETRIFDQKSLIQYVTGLLIFLGLIGTFVGLMQTVSAVGDIIGNLNFTGGGDVTETVQGLITSLKGPLVGMGTGFSSSLFGLVTSLALGLMARFLSSAFNSLTTSFEAWLAGVAKIESFASEDQSAETAGSTPLAGVHSIDPDAIRGMGEGIAQMVVRLEALVRVIEVSGINRTTPAVEPPHSISQPSRRLNRADRMVIEELKKINESLIADKEWRRRLERSMEQMASNAEAERDLTRDSLSLLLKTGNAINPAHNTIMSAAYKDKEHSSSFRAKFAGIWGSKAGQKPTILNDGYGNSSHKLQNYFEQNARIDKKHHFEMIGALMQIYEKTSDIQQQLIRQEHDNRELLYTMTELRRDRREQREERSALRNNMTANERTLWQIQDRLEKSIAEFH